MTPLTFLVLTDHSGHSDQNSVYSLVNTLMADARCKHVDIASRGHADNQSFFKGGGARVQGFQVSQNISYQQEGRQFVTSLAPLDPADYDVIWLRLPHPVPQSFFDAMTDLPALVVNNPAGIVMTGDKSFLLSFPELTPPVKLVHSITEIRDFAQQFPLVLKPLRAYGGKGIVRVDTPDDNIDIDLHEPYLAMKFLKNVSAGDKRILVVNGKILAASLRVPPPGEWLCNVARGGKSVGTGVDPEEEAMIAALAPEILQRGICFAGVDTLTNDDGKRVLSEINTLSIGGFPQAQRQTGRPILQQTIDELFNYCHARL